MPWRLVSPAHLIRATVLVGLLCVLTAHYLARKRAEGKTRIEALRCLKRHLARRIWQLLRAPAPASVHAMTPPSIS